MDEIILGNPIGVFRFGRHTKVVKREKSLRLAVARATGVSLGAAHTIPALLMPEIGGNSILDLHRISVNAEVAEGIRCYRLNGYKPRGISELLISSDDLLILRVRESSYETESRNDIRINQAIDPGIFEFTPPRL